MTINQSTVWQQKTLNFSGSCRRVRPAKSTNHSAHIKGEKLNYKSVAKEISKPPFLAPEVQWASSRFL